MNTLQFCGHFFTDLILKVREEISAVLQNLFIQFNLKFKTLIFVNHLWLIYNMKHRFNIDHQYL